MTKVVGLYAGAGAGKSTVAAELFAMLKYDGVSCELVTEFAKDLVWDKSFKTMDDQIWLFANQHRRITRLLGQVDVVITDSPFVMGLAYCKEKDLAFEEFVLSEHRKLNTYNFFLERNAEYVKGGRVENKEKAERLDRAIRILLGSKGISHFKLKVEPKVTAQKIKEIVTR